MFSGALCKHCATAGSATLSFGSMQVDADLHSFRCDVSYLLLAEAGQPGLADDGVLSR